MSRFLNADKAALAIDQIGLAPPNLVLLQSFLSNTQGMILVTGPSGSGRTATLYSALNSLKMSATNIFTLEDPIEMLISGVSQKQIDAGAGVTFATGLRSILRQKPNVILVGEIRDHETAEIALGAANTGHLLLSSFEASDTAATITRLLDLGIQPTLMAASLLGVVSQRLVWRPCATCAVRQEPSADVVAKLGGASVLPSDGQWVTAGVGCDACDGAGLKGRIALHEVLAVTEEIRDQISRHAAAYMIKKTARHAGMRTLLEDGIDKAAQGLTTLEEVLRVVSPGHASNLAGDSRSPSPSGATPAGEPDTSRHASLGRVLVVEDSPTIVAVAKYFLEREGFEVLVAGDGELGLQMALRERPDVILSDVNMPNMGGVAMVKALRADVRTSNVRIMMLTSESSLDSVTEGMAVGADDYLLKPIEPRRLTARVKALHARPR